MDAEQTKTESTEKTNGIKKKQIICKMSRRGEILGN